VNSCIQNQLVLYISLMLSRWLIVEYFIRYWLNILTLLKLMW